MKRYLPAVAVAAAVAFAAVAATAAPTAMATPAFAPAPGKPAATTASTPTASTSTTAVTKSPVRVVRSGERVDAGRGWTVWLTREGKHWAGPDGFENFRSVVDGNIDPSEPGVSHQSEGDQNGVFHSGLYYGTRKAGKVVLTGQDGTTTTAVLLELPGRPGWGVWYAHAAAEGKGGAAVALYDRQGRLLAELPGWDGRDGRNG
ncbi:hypothetical protein ACIGO8_15810 [Streptomyces sp. NPDC053493]|uniref:hypothetical protein n=1 Tax=Streptomyces sp. NPDC053493 TaxID=3365705 RepID=UPI0037D7E7BC